MHSPDLTRWSLLVLLTLSTSNVVASPISRHQIATTNDAPDVSQHRHRPPKRFDLTALALAAHDRIKGIYPSDPGSKPFVTLPGNRKVKRSAVPEARMRPLFSFDPEDLAMTEGSGTAFGLGVWNLGSGLEEVTTTKDRYRDPASITTFPNAPTGATIPGFTPTPFPGPGPRPNSYLSEAPKNPLTRIWDSFNGLSASALYFLTDMGWKSAVMSEENAVISTSDVRNGNDTAATATETEDYAVNFLHRIWHGEGESCLNSTAESPPSVTNKPVAKSTKGDEPTTLNVQQKANAINFLHGLWDGGDHSPTNLPTPVQSENWLRRIWSASPAPGQIEAQMLLSKRAANAEPEPEPYVRLTLDKVPSRPKKKPDPLDNYPYGGWGPYIAEEGAAKGQKLKDVSTEEEIFVPPRPAMERSRKRKRLSRAPE